MRHRKAYAHDVDGLGVILIIFGIVMVPFVLAWMGV